jgi:hypothetical protein
VTRVRVRWVSPDLTEITRQALIDDRVDMVISHPQEWIALRLLEVMSDAICARAQKIWCRDSAVYHLHCSERLAITAKLVVFAYIQSFFRTRFGWNIAPQNLPDV